jgi:hypothetical protein
MSKTSEITSNKLQSNRYENEDHSESPKSNNNKSRKNLPKIEREKENNESDCESLISEREEIDYTKKEIIQKVIRSKMGGKSILEIAKDLNFSIEVRLKKKLKK